MSNRDDDDEKAPTTMEQIIENGKKDGFYCVFVHSERYEKTSAWLGPFDREVAKFYTERHHESLSNGSTLYKLEGGSTFSERMNGGKDINECFIAVSTENQDIAYGPFGTKKECYEYLLNKKDDDIINNSEIKCIWFSLHNYGKHFHYANWLEKEKEKRKQEKAAELLKEAEDNKIALQRKKEEEEEKQSRKKRKK